MPSFAEIAAPLALILPMHGLGTLPPEPNPPESAPSALAQSAQHSSEANPLDDTKETPPSSSMLTLEAFREGLRLGQIRLEQRVVVRIAPRRVSNRRNMLAQLPVRAQTTRYKERKAEECVLVEGIAGVETGSGNRLLLFMRDANIMSINLEKACRARDFYSGFYVKPNEDGKLCVARDTLQSRNGARCDIERMMELVAVED